ncbi:MAG TPA: helix-turn-helix domain-containing protein [Burkholderiaceae bacterium]|nr:helix-turn-helix domain-containing protein [Burkholderiaceae bacterium]
MPPDPQACCDLRRWNAMAQRTFGDIAVQAAPEGFSATMATRDVAALRLVDVQSTAARVNGSASRRAGWYLLFNRGGACMLYQRGRTVGVEDGELSLLRSDESFEIRFAQPNRMLVVCLPAIGAPGAMDDRVARRHGRHEASVVGALLQRLQDMGPDAARQMDPATLHRALFDLLMLTPPRDDPGQPALPATRRRLLLDRLDGLVARYVSDPDLDAAMLGRALGVSVRHVQALFASQGTTLGTHLLEQRLQLAARRLRDPGKRRERIGSIALESGFGDVSHFCRAFRRRFGCSAGAWRAGA